MRLHLLDRAEVRVVGRRRCELLVAAAGADVDVDERERRLLDRRPRLLGGLGAVDARGEEAERVVDGRARQRLGVLRSPRSRRPPPPRRTASRRCCRRSSRRCRARPRRGGSRRSSARRRSAGAASAPASASASAAPGTDHHSPSCENGSSVNAFTIISSDSRPDLLRLRGVDAERLDRARSCSSARCRARRARR